ncbi:MAG: hypothetical protein JW703_02090 [Candidatus Diapherotrites archaeon]|nr:hypothetical protein [Candidatus Diapherotrites archaeon]
MPGFFKKVKTFLTRRKLTNSAIEKESKNQLNILMNDEGNKHKSINELKQDARKKAMETLTKKGYYL